MRAFDPSLIPHGEQYAGPWAMHETSFRAEAARIRMIGWPAHHAEVQSRGAASVVRPDDPGYELIHDVAVVNVIGPMLKYGSSLFAGKGTLHLRQAVRRAAADPRAKAILLRIDSPGGTVHGTDDFAQDVFNARRTKPIHAYFEDMGASAAYYVGSQASRVSANAGAVIGSIGTYMVLEDWSSFFEDAGVKVHVVRAGAMKGAGEFGTVVTDEQLAEFQREVDAMADLFVRAVAHGRGLPLETARSWNDGRVHLGAAARELGMIDAVETLDEAIAAAAQAADEALPEHAPKTSSRTEKPTASQPTKGESMTAEEYRKKHPDQAAALRDEAFKEGRETGVKEGVQKAMERAMSLSKAFKDRPAFAFEQFLEGRDVAEAKGALADVLVEELKTRDARHAAELAEARRAAAAREEGHPAPLATPANPTQGTSSLPPDQRAKVEWEQNAAFQGHPVRKVFGSQAEFQAYLEAEAAGRIRSSKK